MLAVGQLDQHDAQIARHGHQHLAEVFRLRFLVGRELDAVELGQAVDHLGDLAAEFLGQFVLGRAGVFEHVVQQRGGDGIGIHAPLDDGAGNRQRMRDVGFAGHALLVRMGVGREGVGLLDPLDIDRREIIETIEEYPVSGILFSGGIE